MTEINSKTYDSGAKPSAGSLLSKKLQSSTIDNSNTSQSIEAVDAFGSSGDDHFSFFKKKAFAVANSNLDNYSMNSPDRGYAVIINNENFHPKTRMNKRTGTDIDARNLKNIFKKLGFNVLLKKDATCHQLCQIIHDMSRTDHIGNDCFIFAILSHGDDGCIYGTDGTVPIKDLVDQFRGDVCPSLAGKPKIFMFQACRGTLHEIPVEPADDVVDGESSNEVPHIIQVDAGLTPTLPSGSDFLFCYSVIEGFYSHRDTLFGSWYVQEFTDVMERLVFNQDKAVDFLDVLTLVNKKVAHRSVERSLSAAAIGKKQMPCFCSLLTKKLYLTQKEVDKSH